MIEELCCNGPVRASLQCRRRNLAHVVGEDLGQRSIEQRSPASDETPRHTVDVLDHPEVDGFDGVEKTKVLLDQRLTDALHCASWWWIIVGSKVAKVGWLFLPALFWTLLVASTLSGIVDALWVGMFEDGGGGITASSIPGVEVSVL